MRYIAHICAMHEHTQGVFDDMWMIGGEKDESRKPRTHTVLHTYVQCTNTRRACLMTCGW
jgi:hypothetical protein